MTTALLLLVAAGGLSFTAVQDDSIGLYITLAGIAVVLLVVPLAILGVAAARLSARSHDEPLATVRLLGGTPALAEAVTVIESAALALAGALGGVALYPGLAPLVGLLHFRGSALGSGMYMNPVLVVVLALVVVAMGVVSAVMGLRRLNLSPLGVRTRAVAPTARWIRVVIAGVVVCAAYLALQSLSAFRDFAVMAAVLARGSLRRAENPELLLAARMILESPQGAWRQVSGVAMTSFVAVVGGAGAALIKAGVNSQSPAQDIALAEGVLTGVLVTILVSFIGVCCSAVINQCAQTLDRRELSADLDRLGMDARTMDRSRVRSVMAPLLWVCFGSVLVAGVVMLPLVGIAMIMSPLTLLIVVATLAADVLAVRASLMLAGTRLVLRT